MTLGLRFGWVLALVVVFSDSACSDTEAKTEALAYALLLTKSPREPRPTTGTLVLTVNLDSMVAGGLRPAVRVTAALPRRLELSPGDHLVLATSVDGGEPARAMVDIRQGAQRALSLTVRAPRQSR